MKYILDKITNALTVLSVMLFALIFFTIIAEICCRSVFGFSLLWMNDLVQILICWLLAFSMSTVVYSKSHLCVDFIKLNFSVKVQEILTVLTDALKLVFFLMLVPNGIQTAITKMKISFTTLRWPMGYMYAALPVFAALSSIYAAYLLCCSVRKLVGEGSDQK